MVQVRGLKRKPQQLMHIQMQENSETRRLFAQDAGKSDLNNGNDVTVASSLTDGRIIGKSSNYGNHCIESYNTDESDVNILKGNSNNRQERTTIKITKIYGKIRNDQKYFWLRRCWTIHFILSTCILTIGILQNYNPVK
jgi:hypothetical protein